MSTLPPPPTSEGTSRVAEGTERLGWATYSAAGDRVSGINRDAVVALTRGEEGLFAVADGMGHLKGSENASRIAADRLTALFSRGLGESRTFMERLSETGQAVCAGIREKIELEGGDRSMGTTLTGCAIFGGQYTVFHIGDSRLYHYSGGRVIRRTEDHTRQAESERTGIKVPDGLPPHQLTRALMYADEKTTSIAFYPSDGGTFPLSAGDILIACTDGVHKHLTDSDFMLELEGVSDAASLGKALQRLALRALANGSTDDRSLTGVSIPAVGRASLPLAGGANGRSTHRLPFSMLWMLILGVVAGIAGLLFMFWPKPPVVTPEPTPAVEASPTPFAASLDASPSPSPSPTPDPNSDVNPGEDIPPRIGEPTNQPSPTPAPEREAATDTTDEPKKTANTRETGSRSGIRLPDLNKRNLRKIREKIKSHLPRNVEITIPKPLRTSNPKPTPKPDRPKSTPRPSTSDDDPRRPRDKGASRLDSAKSEKPDDDPRRPRK